MFVNHTVFLHISGSKLGWSGAGFIIIRLILAGMLVPPPPPLYFNNLYRDDIDDMSGPICPECTTFALIETQGHYSCPICGWSGESLPRKIMDAETSERISAKTRRLMNLRLNNQLRYVRVELCTDEDALDRVHCMRLRIYLLL